MLRFPQINMCMELAMSIGVYVCVSQVLTTLVPKMGSGDSQGVFEGIPGVPDNMTDTICIIWLISTSI